MGITHIINLAAAEGYPNQFPFHFTYIKVVVKDSETEPIYTKFQKCNHFISQALRNPKHKVFIHCHAGISRSPTIALAYIIYDKQCSYQKALDLVRNFRFMIKPNPGFEMQLN